MEGEAAGVAPVRDLGVRSRIVESRSACVTALRTGTFDLLNFSFDVTRRCRPRLKSPNMWPMLPSSGRASTLPTEVDPASVSSASRVELAPQSPTWRAERVPFA